MLFHGHRAVKTGGWAAVLLASYLPPNHPAKFYHASQMGLYTYHSHTTLTWLAKSDKRHCLTNVPINVNRSMPKPRAKRLLAGASAPVVMYWVKIVPLYMPAVSGTQCTWGMGSRTPLMYRNVVLSWSWTKRPSAGLNYQDNKRGHVGADRETLSPLTLSYGFVAKIGWALGSIEDLIFMGGRTPWVSDRL